MYPNLKETSLLSLGGFLYYIVAIFSMSIFSFHPSNITLIWMPFGIGVILVHMFGLRALPFIFVGSFLAHFLDMQDENKEYLLYVSISAMADTLAPYLSSRLIKSNVEENCRSVDVLIPFSLYGVIIPTFIGGSIIALNLLIGGYIHLDQVSSFVAIVMFSNGLGLFLLFPIYNNIDTLSNPTSTEWKTALFITLSATALIWYSFDYHFLIFIVLPLLLIAAFKIRISLLTVILFVVVVELVTLSTTEDHGIFNMETDIESILMLMTYLICLLFIVFGASLHNAELLTNIHLTYTDSLTQVKNVRAYKEAISELLSLHERYQTPFSVILFDIDDFKVINDTYGHRVGDIVLTDLCSLIQKNIRANDSLFRVGGEEFIILLSNTSLSVARGVADKILKIIESDLNTIENRCTTISIGVVEAEMNDTEDSLYRRVDALLYQSKQTGKNRVTWGTSCAV